MAGDRPEGNRSDAYRPGGGNGQGNSDGIDCPEDQGGAGGTRFEERNSGAHDHPAGYV